MNTRTNQTVLESRLVTSVVTDNGRNTYQVRCLSSTETVARFIVVSTGDISKNSYQVPILAEARFNFRKDRLSIKTNEESSSFTKSLKAKLEDYLCRGNIANCDLGNANRMLQAF